MGTMVEEPLAGQVMVDSEQVRPGLAARERLDLVGPDAGGEEPLMPVMVRIDPAVEQVEAQPAPLILMRRLVKERRGREGLAEILGLEKPGVGKDPADGPHRFQYSRALG